MNVTQMPGTIFVHEAIAPFTAVSPCVMIDPHTAGCPDRTVRSISIAGGNLNDSFDVSAVGYRATILGNGGNDFLRGGLGNDTLSGNEGNDVLDGGPGADRLNGGHGRDIVTYASHPSGVSVSLDGKRNDGSPGENDLVWTDVEEVDGSPGNDVLVGSTGADDLRGGAGNDRNDGRSGSDLLDGGPGEDTLDYSSRILGVTLNLSSGLATTIGESDRISGFEDVLGSKRDDRLTGDAGPNRLAGGGGNDLLDGGGDPDVLIGGSGFDTATYAGRSAPVIVSLDGRANDGAAGEGDNVTPSVEGAIGGRGADRLTGNSRSNRLRGGAGNDTLRGGRGRDMLEGGTGRDILFGGPGADFLSGGSGRDRVSGGSGTDVAVADRRDRVTGVEHVRRR
jgi:Ca2+-binding RTX toxin-like protein